MPIDVSILRQQAPMQMPSLMESRARANQLISSDMQMAANMLQLQKAEREQQEQEQVRNLLTGGQFDVSAPESMSRLAAYGGAGREAAKTLGEAFKARKEGEAARLKGQESLLSIIKQQTEAAAGLLPSVKDYPSAKRYLDMVWSSPELAQRLRDAGQSPEADDKEVQEAIATGRLNDWLLRESRGAGDISKRLNDQSALKTALTAANEKFRTQSGADGRAVRVGFDLKGHTTEVVSNLMQQGRSDLAEQYIKQQLEMAKLKYAHLSPEAATLAAMRDNPELFEMARQLKAAGANRQTVSVGGQVYKTELAKETVEIVRNAPKAVQALEKAKATLDLLKKGKANTGFAAQFRTDIARAVALFSKRAPESVTQTETLQALLGSDVFPMIQSLGIGARGLDTPAERDFLMKVMTGTIELDNTTLQELTRIRARVFQRAIDEYNERLRNGEFDDYMAETKRTLKPIKAPSLDEETQAPAGAGAGAERKPLSDIFKK